MNVLIISAAPTKRNRLVNAFQKDHTVITCEWNDLLFTEKVISLNSKSLSYFHCIIVGSRYQYLNDTSRDRIDVSELYHLLTSYNSKNFIRQISFTTTNLVATKITQLELGNSLHTPFIPTRVHIQTELESAIRDLQFPIVLKHPDLDRGEGVFLVKNTDEIRTVLQKYPEQKLWLTQPLIPNNGDFRVLCATKKVLGVMKRERVDQNEFRNNVSLGATAKVAELPQYIVNDCETIASLLQCDLLGIDIIQDSITKQYYIMEINTNPQIAGFENATKIDVINSLYSLIIS